LNLKLRQLLFQRSAQQLICVRATGSPDAARQECISTRTNNGAGHRLIQQPPSKTKDTRTGIGDTNNMVALSWHWHHCSKERVSGHSSVLRSHKGMCAAMPFPSEHAGALLSVYTRWRAVNCPRGAVIKTPSTQQGARMQVDLGHEVHTWLDRLDRRLCGWGSNNKRGFTNSRQSRDTRQEVMGQPGRVRLRDAAVPNFNVSYSCGQA